MSNLNRFAIQNDLSEPAILNIEPEGQFLPLVEGEEVVVVDAYAEHPVTVRLGKTDEGRLVISIWPGDGEVGVEKGGVNVFEEGAPAARRGPRVAKPAASS
jgi:hypothetical protein